VATNSASPLLRSVSEEEVDLTTYEKVEHAPSLIRIPAVDSVSTSLLLILKSNPVGAVDARPEWHGGDKAGEAKHRILSSSCVVATSLQYIYPTFLSATVEVLLASSGASRALRSVGRRRVQRATALAHVEIAAAAGPSLATTTPAADIAVIFAV